MCDCAIGQIAGLRLADKPAAFCKEKKGFECKRKGHGRGLLKMGSVTGRTATISLRE
jgi:hypothetical protein